MRRDVNKDLRDDRKEMRKLQRKERFNTLISDWSVEMESMSDISRVREGISGMKSFNEWAGVLGKFQDTALTRALDKASEPERVWCEDIASKSLRIPGEGGDGSVVTKTGSSTKPGAYILARKSALQTPPTEEEPYYDYWIEGGVSPQADGLKFKVFLYDVNGRKSDYTEEIVRGDAIADKTDPEYFGGIDNQHRLKSEENYDKVCIYFETNRLSDYFYSVDLRGKELCQKFVGEN